MKYLRTLLFSLALVRARDGLAQKRILLAPTRGFLYLENKGQVGPGDTLVLQPGTYSFIYFGGLHGTPAHPVVICNGSGQVRIHPHNLALMNCTYIHLSGSGDPSIPFGIFQTGPAYAFQIRGRCAHIELDHLEAYHCGIGIEIKNDPDCDPGSWNGADSGAFVMDGFYIHDNLIIGTAYEGTYIGATLNDSSLTYGCCRGYRVDCGGKRSYHFAYRLGHVRFLHNRLDSTHNDGIQIVDVLKGTVEIAYNRVDHAGMGQSANSGQSQGMSLGPFRAAYIHDNRVEQTSGAGIAYFGTGEIRISRNLIGHTGIDGILVDSRREVSLYPQTLQWTIWDNQILDAGGWGIVAYNTNRSTSAASYIRNNRIRDAHNGIFHAVRGLRWRGDYGSMP